MTQLNLLAGGSSRTPRPSTICNWSERLHAAPSLMIPTSGAGGRILSFSSLPLLWRDCNSTIRCLSCYWGLCIAGFFDSSDPYLRDDSTADLSSCNGKPRLEGSDHGPDFLDRSPPCSLAVAVANEKCSGVCHRDRTRTTSTGTRTGTGTRRTGRWRSNYRRSTRYAEEGLSGILHDQGVLYHVIARVC